MKYYLAPLEGITGYIYRNAYHKCFQPMDKYFTPFLTPNQNKTLKSKELNDILPENNRGLKIVPQILTNHGADFISTVEKLQFFGYKEVNLNLGCPSRTVVTKNKGAGFLAQREQLNQFLEFVFSNTTASISVKTRIGKESPDEFRELLKIYNQYPLEELIIHPRTQTDYYNNHPNLEMFQYGMENGKAPVCYNGDIFRKDDYENLRKEFQEVETVMLGRGILRNPNFAGLLKGEAELTKEKLQEFHDILYNSYKEVLFGDRNVLFKMKELWFYLINLFPDAQKYEKKIKKSQRGVEYEENVQKLFEEKEIVER
jgi:tRNA-dihydrouridine synthase